MKYIVLILLTILLVTSCQKSEDLAPDFYTCNSNFADSSSTNPNNSKYQTLLNDITGSGVVGITMSVYHSNKGIWIGASGKSDLHNNIDMKPCNISRITAFL